VRGDVHFYDGFKTEGGLTLTGENIAGVLNCEKANLEAAAPTRWAFVADHAKIGRGLLLRYGI
jgi:hypothetical protein